MKSVRERLYAHQHLVMTRMDGDRYVPMRTSPEAEWPMIHADLIEELRTAQ